jgi:U-box domain
MADPLSIATAMKAITPVTGMIEKCLAKYKDFHSFKKECTAFRSVLRELLVSLGEIQNDIRAGNCSGNTKLQRPMELLKSATVEGGRVLDECSSMSQFYFILKGEELMGKLGKASGDIKLGLDLLGLAGIQLQLSQRRMMDSAVSRLEQLIHQIVLTTVTSKQELADLIRTIQAELQQHAESQAAEKQRVVVGMLVEKGLVSDAQDYSDKLVELQQQAVSISQEKVVYSEASLDLVMQLTALQHKVEVEGRQGSEMLSAVRDGMTCPISSAVMKDPVTLVESGQTYDRESLCTSLLSYPNLEPATGERFDRPLSYTPNITVRKLIMAQHGDAHYQKHDDGYFKVQYEAKWKELVGPLPSVVVVVHEQGGPGSSIASEYAGSVLADPMSAAAAISVGGGGRNPGDLGGSNGAGAATPRGGCTESGAKNPVDKLGDSGETTHNDQFSSDPEDVEEAGKPEAGTAAGGTLQTFWRSRRVRWLVAGAVLAVLVIIVIVGVVVGVLKAGSPPTTPEKFNATLPPYTIESLQDPTSPQFRAYQWVTLSDQVPERDAPNDEATRIFRMTQRFAVATLLYSLGRDSWIEATVSECEWGNPTSGRNVKCNADLRVVVLAFQRAGVRDGSIPREIGLLTNLTSLDLFDNSLSSSAPTELGQLSALTYLDLHSNKLNSSIPTELGQLSALAVLRLDSNLLTAVIPTELGQLSALALLRLDSNLLTAAIPTELGRLSGLTYFDLGSNELTSSIPTDLGQLSAVTVVSLAYNSLTSSIPTELGQLSVLTLLNLDSNSLTSTIPTELGQLSNLDQLYLAQNLFTGSFPDALCLVRDIRIDCSEVACSCCSGCS